RVRAEFEAMSGRIDEGRLLIGQAKSLALELGLRSMAMHAVGESAGDIELQAGDPEAAERELRGSYDWLEAIGDWGHLSTIAGNLADALLQQGRAEEAAPIIDLAARLAIEDDADAQIGVRRVRGRLLAERGQLEEAEQVAREATARAALTDFLNVRGQALCDLAEVLALAGKDGEAADAFVEAIALYERKGNVVM